MEEGVLAISALIVLLCINSHLKKVIKRGDNFDGIIWGILTGIFGSVLWFIVSYFSIKSSMKALSRRSGYDGELTPAMSGTLHEYLLGMLIGIAIGFIIGAILSWFGVHFS